MAPPSRACKCLSYKALWRRKRQRVKGLEPSTFSLEGCAPTVLSAEDAGLTDGDDGACTNACTKSTESGHEMNLEALAAALLNLSPDDRAKLAAMLADGKTTSD